MTDDEILDLIDKAIANKVHILIEAQTEPQARSALHRISSLLRRKRPSIRVFTSPVTGSIHPHENDMPVASNDPRKRNMPGPGDVFICEKFPGKHPEISDSMKGCTIITTSISSQNDIDVLIRPSTKLELMSDG